MSNSKSAQFEQNHVYAPQAPADSPDIQALRNFQMPKTLLTPTQNYGYAQAQQQINAGSNVPPGTTNPFQRAQLRTQGTTGVMGERSGALVTGSADYYRFKMAQLEALAGITKPEVKETKTYGYGPAPQGPSLLSSLIGAAGQVGSAALGAYLGAKPPATGTADMGGITGG
jgi:hypothetical protein